jgi:hypothetical protein
MNSLFNKIKVIENTKLKKRRNTELWVLRFDAPNSPCPRKRMNCHLFTDMLKNSIRLNEDIREGAGAIQRKQRKTEPSLKKIFLEGKSGDLGQNIDDTCEIH